MSRPSTMQFAQNMLSRSIFLREHCDDLEDFQDPDCPLAICMLGDFGWQIADSWDAIKPDEWALLSAEIEQGLSSHDDDVVTAVATGLIEAMINRAEVIDDLWPKIEASLGPQARRYADAYREAI